MSDPFTGEIRMFGFGYAPENWAFCNGAQMNISQFTALFSIINVVYGGDGKRTFNLPNLQGRAPLGMGQGPGLTAALLGKTAGVESVALSAPQLAGHQHQVHAVTVPNSNVLTNAPSATSAISTTGGQRDFSKTNIDPWRTTTGLAAQTIGSALGNKSGAADPHENRQPYLPLNFCICLNGTYPIKS